MENSKENEDFPLIDIRRVLFENKANSKFGLNLSNGQLVVIENANVPNTQGTLAAGRIALTQTRGLVPLSCLSSPLKGVKSEAEAVRLNSLLTMGLRRASAGIIADSPSAEDNNEHYYSEADTSHAERDPSNPHELSQVIDYNDELWGYDSFTDSEEEDEEKEMKAPQIKDSVPQSTEQANSDENTIIGQILSDYRVNEGTFSLSLEKGEFVTIIDMNYRMENGHFILVARRREPHDVAFIPHYVVQVLPGLESQPWYTGKMNKKSCDSLLMNSGIDRIFIVRDLDSVKRGFIISVRVGDHIRCKKVLPSKKGYFIIPSCCFPTMAELVTYHLSQSDPSLYIGIPFNKYILYDSASSTISPLSDRMGNQTSFKDTNRTSQTTAVNTNQLLNELSNKFSIRPSDSKNQVESSNSRTNNLVRSSPFDKNNHLQNPFLKNDMKPTLSDDCEHMSLHTQFENISRIQQMHLRLVEEQNKLSQHSSVNSVKPTPPIYSENIQKPLPPLRKSFPEKESAQPRDIYGDPSSFKVPIPKNSSVITSPKASTRKTNLVISNDIQRGNDMNNSSPKSPLINQFAQTKPVSCNSLLYESDQISPKVGNKSNSSFPFRFKMSSLSTKSNKEKLTKEPSLSETSNTSSLKFLNGSNNTSEPDKMKSKTSGKESSPKVPKFNFSLPKPSFDFDVKMTRDKVLKDFKSEKNFKSNIGSHWKVNYADIEWLGVIGSGYYGDVWKGRWKGYSHFVAVKTFKSAKMSNKDFFKEATSMVHLRHPNLVKLFGVSTKEEEACLMMQFHPLGSILDYFKKGKKLDSRQMMTFSYQVASGMDYLGDQGFVHRDLAARNVLIDDNLDAKIADFGLTRSVKDKAVFLNDDLKMPWKWTAPEGFREPPLWSALSDVWSYGVLLWEIYSGGKHPYGSITRKSELIQFLEASHRLARPPSCTQWIYSSIMLPCWKMSAVERISFKEIKALWTSKMSVE